MFMNTTNLTHFCLTGGSTGTINNKHVNIHLQIIDYLSLTSYPLLNATSALSRDLNRVQVCNVYSNINTASNTKYIFF